MAGSVTIQIKKYDKLKSSIDGLKTKAANANRNAVKDMKSRAPGWIATAVTGRYNIKKSEIMPESKSAKKPQKKAGGITVAGETIETLTFTYKGRLLTPTHFAMKPGQRPKSTKDDTGRTTKKARGYQVSAEIIKGQRKNLGHQVFLGTNKGAGVIPFQRKGDARLPLAAVKTTSVPQMIQNEQVEAEIQTSLNTGLETRLKHHIGRQGL